MDVIVLSENLKIFAELVLSFFSCVGIVYMAHDFISFILKNKKKTYAVAIIDLTNSLCPTREILDFTVFYHSTHAERFIEKIIFIGVPETLKESESELKEVLRIPLEFSERN